MPGSRNLELQQLRTKVESEHVYDDYLAFIKAVRLYGLLQWAASQRNAVTWDKAQKEDLQ